MTSTSALVGTARNVGGGRKVAAAAVLSWGGALLAPALAAAQPAAVPKPIDESLTAAFAAQIRESGRPALDYVVGKFAGHQLVLLGEGPHRVRQNLEFLQALIPRLHAAGVYNLGFEMVRSATQKDVDRLLAGSTYDEKLATRIVLDYEGVHFGWYREYADVLRAAWKVNSTLPRGAPRFRVLGLDTFYRAVDWSQLRPGEKGTDEAVTQRIVGLRTRDVRWAEIIDQEIVQKGEKGLIYGGIGHLNTRFHRDRGFGTHERRAGNLLYSYLGDKVFGIFLHGPSTGVDTQALERMLAATSAASSGPAAAAGVGFDTRPGTAIGNLPSSEYGYIGRGPRSSGYRPAMRCGNQFTLADTTDGYVYLLPVSQFRMVNRIEGALTPENVLELQRRLQVEAGDQELTVTREEIERMSQDADAKWRAEIEGKAGSR